MKKVILVSMFCFIAFINGYSQTKQESIKELFHVMQIDSLIDKMFTSMMPTMFNQMKTEIKDSASIALLEETTKAEMQTLKGITKRMMNEDMVTIYDKYFTQNEINDYIRFYKSPSGQKQIKVTPDIQKDLMQVMLQKYMPEIQSSMKAKMAELKNNKKK